MPARTPFPPLSPSPPLSLSLSLPPSLSFSLSLSLTPSLSLSLTLSHSLSLSVSLSLSLSMQRRGGRPDLVRVRGEDVLRREQLPAGPGVGDDESGPSLRHRAPPGVWTEERLHARHVSSPPSPHRAQKWVSATAV